MAAKRSMVDWSALPEELVDLILAKLYTLLDYIRFRAVCKTWRSVALYQKPKRFTTMDQLPPLLMVANFALDSYALYAVEVSKFEPHQLSHRKVDEGKLPVYPSPPLPKANTYYSSSYGWLLRFNLNSEVGELFNPCTKKTIIVPSPLRGSNINNMVRESSVNRIGKVILSCNPTIYPRDYLIVALCFTQEGVCFLAFKKVGKNGWDYIGTNKGVKDIIFYEGYLLMLCGESLRLYVLDYKNNYGAGRWVDLYSISNDIRYDGDKYEYEYDDEYVDDEDGQLATINRSSHGKVSTYLLEDSNGDLLFIEKINRRSMVKDKFKVYKYTKDLEFGWRRITKLENNDSIFLADDDQHGFISLSCVSDFNQNAIYFCRNNPAHLYASFRISDGTLSAVPNTTEDRDLITTLIWVTPTLS